MGWLLKLATGNPLTLLWIAGGVFLAGLAVGGGGAWKVQGWRLDAAKAATVVVQTKFDAFVSQAKALGDAQNAKAKETDLINQQRVKDALNENVKTKSALAIALNSLRSATPDPHSRQLPSAAPGSNRPDLICLDRAEYQRTDGDAVARLFDGARKLADEGTAATIDLNTAKSWAQTP